MKALKSRSQGGGLSDEVSLELWRNYEISYVKKTEVEVLPVVDLSQGSIFFFFVGDVHN